jgi:hypothetical protein
MLNNQPVTVEEDRLIKWAAASLYSGSSTHNILHKPTNPASTQVVLIRFVIPPLFLLLRVKLLSRMQHNG